MKLRDRVDLPVWGLAALGFVAGVAGIQTDRLLDRASGSRSADCPCHQRADCRRDGHDRSPATGLSGGEYGASEPRHVRIEASPAVLDPAQAPVLAQESLPHGGHR